MALPSANYPASLMPSPGEINADKDGGLLFETVTLSDKVIPGDHCNTMAVELEAVQTELGTDPAGSKTDVKTRLAVSLADDGSITATDAVRLDGEISPSQITGSQNNYNPSGLATANTMRLTSDGAYNITGLNAQSDGHLLLVVNVGSNTLTLKDEDAASSAANRFALTHDFALPAAGAAILRYDATATRWHLAGGVPKAYVDSSVALRGYIDGLILSNDTDTDHDINITAGVATDAGNAVLMSLSSETTKQIDAAWSVGDDAGGMLSGSVAADTWYHVFLIRRSDTGVVDAGFYTALDPSGVLPTNYDQYRRIGSVLTDGSANIIGFSQVGDEFLWDDPPLDIDVSNPGTSAVLRTLSVPPDVKVWANFTFRHFSSGVNIESYFSAPDVDDEAPSDSAGPLSDGNSSTGYAWVHNHSPVRTNTSGQVRSRITNSDANTSLRMVTRGWIDQRGKDA